MSTDSHDSRDNSYPNTPDEEIKQQSVDESLDDDVFNPYLFIAQLPDHELVRKNHIVLPSLPHSSTEGHPMTLVLDLDETLVHCTVEPIPKPDLIFPVEFNGNVYQVYVRKRPYLDYFLETVSKNFEVSYSIYFIKYYHLYYFLLDCALYCFSKGLCRCFVG